jgi:hypothetical protein
MGEIDINLILQLLILIIGAIIAWMVRRGWLDRKTVEDAKDIAKATTAGIDKLKEIDPEAATHVLKEVLSRIGVKKGVLDAFLKEMNLNKPRTGAGGGNGGQGEGG